MKKSLSALSIFAFSSLIAVQAFADSSAIRFLDRNKTSFFRRDSFEIVINKNPGTFAPDAIYRVEGAVRTLKFMGTIHKVTYQPELQEDGLVLIDKGLPERVQIDSDQPDQGTGVSSFVADTDHGKLMCEAEHFADSSVTAECHSL